MTKITTDFTGVEPSATRLSRLGSIYDFWWGAGAFVLAGTLGTVRTTMNGIAPDDTSNGEAFGSWLTKWNALNEPDKLLNDTLKDANPGLFVLADDTARVFGADGVTAVSAPGDAVSLIGDDWDGIETGSELVTGSPTLPTGWSGSGPWTKVAGVANSATWSVGTLTSGKAYMIAVTYDAIIASTVTARLTGGATVTGVARSAAGSYRQVIIATAAHTTLDLQATATTAAVVSSVSVREITNWPAYQNTAAARPTWGRAPKEVRNLLLGTATMATQSRAVTAAQHTLSFKGTGTVTLSGVSTSGPLVGTGVGDRVSLTFTPTAGTLTMTVSGSVTEAQLELGASASAYQAVGAATNDITESGVTSFGLISMDGSDDALLHQLANGGTVAVALFGRGGSYLIPSITLAAPSVLQLGPLSVLDDGVLVSGCPTGILQAVGTVPWSSRFELVGYAIMKANPTAEEKARAMRYFAAHGARGWLVEGANLVPPNIDGDGWGTDVFPSSPATRSGVQVTFSTTFSHWRQTVPVDFAGQWFRHQFTARLISGNANLNFYLPTLGVSPQAGQAGTGITVTSTAQTFTLDVFSTAGSSQPMSFGIQDRNASGFGTVEITNASLTKFTPEF